MIALESNDIDLFAEELLYWHQKPAVPQGLMLNRLLELSRTHQGLAIFRVAGDKVLQVNDAVDANESNRFRMDLYRSFFDQNAKIYPFESDFIFGAFLDDGDLPLENFPIFSFQKLRSSKNLLIPDVDMLAFRFYGGDDLEDIIPYEQKHNSAIFVGATTGADQQYWNGLPVRVVSIANVENGRVPRIKSAQFFKGSERVRFELPVLVQCDGPSTEEYLRSLGFGAGQRISLQDQLTHKFMISMDGNGAACSRPAIALRSSSVMLKYDSDSIIYFFKRMVPWKHYIPISDDRDVLEIIEIEDSYPGIFAPISAAASDLFKDEINEDSVRRYTFNVLDRYQRLVNRK